MSDLADRYRKAVSFDVPELKARYDFETRTDLAVKYAKQFIEGVRWENTRRAKIDEAVVDIVQGLDDWRNAWASQDTSGAEPARQRMLKAMNRLDEMLSE